MKVLINALSARQRGGQTYLLNLLAFVPRDGSIDILLLAPASLELNFEHPYIRRLSVSSALDNPVARAAWEKLALPRIARRFGAEVLFCPGGVVGCVPPGCKVVTMFRNMMPFDREQRNRYPAGYERARLWILHRVMLRSMLRADLVIFISQYAKQVIDGFLKGRTVTSTVIPHGIAEQFRRGGGALAPSAALLPASGYLLYVSYIDFYKAQVEVVQAFAMLKHLRTTPEKLLLVGPENPEYGRRLRREIEALGLQDDVVLTGPLPYAELPYLYRHARINIFASESENCPNILLEALAAGRPVLSSSKNPMPEFGGDGAMYFDPRTPADLAGRLNALLQDEAAMDALGARAVQRAALYDWKDAAASTWGVISRLAAS